jgi:hypothetical protein
MLEQNNIKQDGVLITHFGLNVFLVLVSTQSS